MEGGNDGTEGRHPQVVEVQHDPETHLGTTIVHAVCRASGLEVDELGVELNEVVNPDALDRLFADRLDGTPRKGGKIVFSILDFEVTVDGSGHVVVTPL
ncbi:MAG: HalOD1 output domain-containing protein [Halobacteriota archaeon]